MRLLIMWSYTIAFITYFREINGEGCKGNEIKYDGHKKERTTKYERVCM